MKDLLTRVKRLHDRFFDLVSYLQTPFLLFVRLYWGWQLIESGWGKLHHLSNVTDYFTSLGLPMPAQMALAISCLEFFGGIFLALGLLSRLTALVLTVNMIAGLHHRGPRGAFLDFFRPGQIRGGRAVYIPRRICDHPGLWSRQDCGRHASWISDGNSTGPCVARVGKLKRSRTSAAFR